GRNQSRQDDEPQPATLEWRMDHERAGKRAAEALAAQLRELPHARADREIRPRQGRVPESASPAHGKLRQPEHAGASAAPGRNTAPGGAWRRARDGSPATSR